MTIGINLNNIDDIRYNYMLMYFTDMKFI